MNRSEEELLPRFSVLGQAPESVKRYGLLGLLGVVVFVSSLIVLHLMSSGIEWTRHYVSSLANEPLGWIFVGAAFVHGWGNLALTMGLRGALHPGRLRTWAVLFFGLAAVGILLAALFPIDPPGQAPSMTGHIHRIVGIATFLFELIALFIFSVAFGRHRRWHRQQSFSLVLFMSAAVALTAFVIAIQMDVAQGLAERTAMVVFLTWEIWVSLQLIRPT